MASHRVCDRSRTVAIWSNNKTKQEIGGMIHFFSSGLGVGSETFEVGLPGGYFFEVLANGSRGVICGLTANL